jgi:predicted ArsR family transcriptional regulator
MSRVPDGQSAGRGDSRTEIIQALKGAASPMSIVQIAELVGLHPNTVRFHLDVLVANRQVESIAPERGGRGRPALLFRADRGMDPAGPRHYRLLAEILTFQLADDADPSARAVEAGRAWGRHVAPSFRPVKDPQHRAAGRAVRADGQLGEQESVELLVDLLDSLGFAPDRRDLTRQPRQIGVHNCPFLELAETSRNLVCPIHLGLMQGAMTSWDAPLTVDGLEAFAEPDLCLAHFTTTSEAPS